MRIDQFVPVLFPQDAIGNHALQVRRALQRAGIQSDLYAERIHHSLATDALQFDPTTTSAERLNLLYHASTSSPMASWLASMAERGSNVMMYYHNITPARYFEYWLPEATESMRAARRDLVTLAPHTSLAIAPSRFSESELVEVGYSHTAVSPLLVDLEPMRQARRTSSFVEQVKARPHRTTWLFVGRFAPNKSQIDLVASFAVYKQLTDPLAHLRLVGGGTAPRYKDAVIGLADELGVAASIEILDGVTNEALLRFYGEADVFVSMSEHEGFCVPLLEAMASNVPVVAFAAAAVPETLGKAGVQLQDKDPLAVASIVDDLLTDADRVAQSVALGQERSVSLDLAATSRSLVGLLSSAAI